MAECLSCNFGSYYASRCQVAVYVENNGEFKYDAKTKFYNNGKIKLNPIYYEDKNTLSVSEDNLTQLTQLSKGLCDENVTEERTKVNAIDYIASEEENALNDYFEKRGKGNLYEEEPSTMIIKTDSKKYISNQLQLSEKTKENVVS